MRTLLSLLAPLALALLPSIHMAAQHGNYVRTEVMLDGNGTRSFDNVQFLDGLGRLAASATNGLGGQGRYTYTLDGNRLKRVDDAAAPVLHSGAFDFTDNTVETDGAEYAYNANGALTMDANRGITRILKNPYGCVGT